MKDRILLLKIKVELIIRGLIVGILGVIVAVEAVIGLARTFV
jgi:hypothetical protein